MKKFCGMEQVSAQGLTLLGFLAILAWSCGDPNRPKLPTAPTVAAFVKSGWDAYQRGDYETAIKEFNSAVARDAAAAEAFLGLGFGYTRLGEFVKANTNFVLLLSLDISNQLRADGYAGLAGSRLAASQDSLAILAAQQALQIGGDNYVFSRDPSLTAADIKLLIAQAYFNMEDFYHALPYVTALAPDFPDPAEYATVVDSTMKIVSELVAVKEDTLYHVMLQNPAHDKIIRVLSVRDERGQSYAVTKVLNLSGGIQNGIDLGLFPAGVPSGRKFIVEYSYYLGSYSDYVRNMLTKINQLYGVV